MEEIRDERRTVTVVFDSLIERARLERDVHQQLDYGRNDTFVKPWVSGWWEHGKAYSSFADLVVDERSPRFHPPSN